MKERQIHTLSCLYAFIYLFFLPFNINSLGTENMHVILNASRDFGVPVYQICAKSTYIINP